MISSKNSPSSYSSNACLLARRRAHRMPNTITMRMTTTPEIVTATIRFLVDQQIRSVSEKLLRLARMTHVLLEAGLSSTSPGEDGMLGVLDTGFLLDVLLADMSGSEGPPPATEKTPMEESTAETD